MNLVGKIFVFLIFSMSLVFCSFSVMVYSSHKDWVGMVNRTKEEATGDKKLGLKYQLENSQNENKKLEDDKKRLEDMIATEYAARRQAIAKLETEKERLLASQQEAQGNNEELLSIHQGVLNKIESALGELKRAESEVAMLRNEKKELQGENDTLYAATIVQTDRVHQLGGESARLKQRNEQLAVMVAQAKKLLGTVGLNINSPIDPSQIKLNGLVKEITHRNQDAFVTVTLGSDDGLREGHRLEVFRGSKYLGSVIVARTFPDRAVAKVDPERRVGPIHVQDRVETRSSLRTQI